MFLDIDLEPGVAYTFSDTSGERPVTATFTPAEPSADPCGRRSW